MIPAYILEDPKLLAAYLAGACERFAIMLANGFEPEEVAGELLELSRCAITSLLVSNDAGVQS